MYTYSIVDILYQINHITVLSVCNIYEKIYIKPIILRYKYNLDQPRHAEVIDANRNKPIIFWYYTQHRDWGECNGEII